MTYEKSRQRHVTALHFSDLNSARPWIQKVVHVRRNASEKRILFERPPVGQSYGFDGFCSGFLLKAARREKSPPERSIERLHTHNTWKETIDSSIIGPKSKTDHEWKPSPTTTFNENKNGTSIGSVVSVIDINRNRTYVHWTITSVTSLHSYRNTNVLRLNMFTRQ